MEPTLKLIQEAIERIENAIDRCPSGSRRNAELNLAWHRIMDGYSLIINGNLTPDDFVWGEGAIARIVSNKDKR